MTTTARTAQTLAAAAGLAAVAHAAPAVAAIGPLLLGRMAVQHPGVARSIADVGHEIAVHGHDHRLLLKRRPADTRADLTHAVHAIETATGQTPRWWRHDPAARQRVRHSATLLGQHPEAILVLCRVHGDAVGPLREHFSRAR